MGEEVIADEDLLRTEFYCDWLQHLKRRRNCGVIVAQTPVIIAALSVVRERGCPPFARPELALFRARRAVAPRWGV